jgi:hypothetical protein
MALGSVTYLRRQDLLDTIKLLDKAPVSLLVHQPEAHKELVSSKAHKHAEADDSHSLQGNYGRMHGVC